MRIQAVAQVFWLSAVVLLALWMPGKVSIWVDEDGRAVLSNQAPPEDVELLEAAQLAAAWQGNWVSEPLVTPSSDPLVRELAEALDDIRRGEQRAALQSLRRLSREYPARPEVFWALARVELARGRHPAALSALDTALSLAAEMPSDWRTRAADLRDRVALELQHAETRPDGAETGFVQESQNFRLAYDHPFAGRGYGDGVLNALERVRLLLERDLGRVLLDPLEVRLYTRADYLHEYGHRFGFGTVGFYDGAIHVVAARHPERRLVALLAHEYTHALFFSALGSHRPFFLNEGLAERSEGGIEGRQRLARGEWRRLLDAQREDLWIPLAELVDAFNRLAPERVPLAYLEARAAVELLEDRAPGSLGRWLTRCANGEPWDEALTTESGWQLGEFDRALRESVRSRFSELPEAFESSPGSGSGLHQE